MAHDIQSFHGHITSGKIQLDDRNDFLELIRSMDGERIEISIRKERDPQSIEQMRKFYWKVIVRKYAEHSGYTEEETHRAFKRYSLIDRSGMGLPRVRSTRSLTTDEFSIYIENCICLAASMGIIIPEPRSRWY